MNTITLLRHFLLLNVASIRFFVYTEEDDLDQDEDRHMHIDGGRVDSGRKIQENQFTLCVSGCSKESVQRH
jgi:hypothetical protein